MRCTNSEAESRKWNAECTSPNGDHCPIQSVFHSVGKIKRIKRTRMVGRAPSDPGLPGPPWKTREPTEMTCFSERNERFIERIGIRWWNSARVFWRSGSFFVGVHALCDGWPANPGSTEPLPTAHSTRCRLLRAGLDRRFSPWAKFFSPFVGAVKHPDQP
jgi:hypothetical protein